MQTSRSSDTLQTQLYVAVANAKAGRLASEQALFLGSSPNKLRLLVVDVLKVSSSFCKRRRSRRWPISVRRDVCRGKIKTMSFDLTME